MADELILRVLEGAADLAAAAPVMLELRVHLSEAEFVARVEGQYTQGYRLLAAERAGRCVGLAGFRLGDNLAWGHFLYVDDLVTLPSERSRGVGRALLEWLAGYARREGCSQLHLDSGTQRLDAHRFYEREHMRVSSYHFQRRL